MNNKKWKDASFSYGWGFLKPDMLSGMDRCQTLTFCLSFQLSTPLSSSRRRSPSRRRCQPHPLYPPPREHYVWKWKHLQFFPVTLIVFSSWTHTLLIIQLLNDMTTSKIIRAFLLWIIVALAVPPPTRARPATLRSRRSIADRILSFKQPFGKDPWSNELGNPCQWVQIFSYFVLGSYHSVSSLLVRNLPHQTGQMTRCWTLRAENMTFTSGSRIPNTTFLLWRNSWLDQHCA